MERKMGLFSRLAFSNASSHQGYQSTGYMHAAAGKGISHD